MKKIMTILVALAITTMSMGQSTFPSKALTFSGSGSVGKNSTSYFAGSVGTINKLAGVLYVQPRATFLLADGFSALNVGVTPTVPIKTWGSASLYVGTEVSLAFVKDTDTYVQVSPEVGVLCSVGKNAYALTRLNYDIKDNVNRNVNLSVGVGFRL